MANELRPTVVEGIREKRHVLSPIGVIRWLSSPRPLLILGICLRAIVFIFLNPENVDGHSLVVSFIAQQGRIPHSGELGQAYHPPLYYCLAAPLYRWSGSFKIVQVLSLFFSVLTLFVLYRLIYHSGLIRKASTQRYCLLLACFLPQFVLYTLFVSNDSLAIFLGSALAWCVTVFIRDQGWKTLSALVVVESLGLLTKATFLAYVPIVLLLIFYVRLMKTRSLPRALATFAAVLILVVTTPTYKEIDNYRQYHRAFVSNIDFHPDWAIRQERTYQGLSSYFNINLLRLVSSPSYAPSTESAYPLMLYGTFWYQHVPECNFMGSSHAPFTWIGSATYVFALLPTTAFLAGLWVLCSKFPQVLSPAENAEFSHQAVTNHALVGLFLGNLGIMVAALVKYHVWSIMQGRLLFPSLFGIFLVFAAGVEPIERIRKIRTALKLAMVALSILFVAYLAGEIGLQIIWRFIPPLKTYLKSVAA